LQDTKFNIKRRSTREFSWRF